jgi:hypothetical protein
MTDLTLPSIHLNGTGRKMLTEDYTAAYHALQTAFRAFQSIDCNGRDYYPQGPNAYSEARRQRDAQLQHLSEVQHYLESHLLHLCE